MLLWDFQAGEIVDENMYLLQIFFLIVGYNVGYFNLCLNIQNKKDVLHVITCIFS